jgi:NDP-sugar pyrophosphorylase family protein
MIPALVLTAGLATRLRPLSLVRAKSALPVAGDPLARRILRWLAGFGVTDAVLNLHHLPHTITGIIGDGADVGVRVRYSWEMPVLGSAGGPRRALPLLAASPFLIVNGDTLTDVDIAALVADHRESGALVTMAVAPNTEPAKYGGVVVESDGTVSGFAKRSRTSPFDQLRATPSNVEGSKVRAAGQDVRAAEQTYHFVGVQVAEAEAFASLPENVPSESVAERYPALIAERRGSVRAFVTSAEFFDIGTPADYLRTSLLLTGRDPRVARAGERSRIDTRATVEQSVVWDDVEVGADVRLYRCVVTDGVRVPAGSSWENATIRVVTGDLMDAELLVGELAIGSIP